MFYYKSYIEHLINFSIKIFNSLLLNFGLLHDIIIKPTVIFLNKYINFNIRLVNTLFDTLMHNYYNFDIFSKNSKVIITAAGRFANKNIFFSLC